MTVNHREPKPQKEFGSKPIFDSKLRWMGKRGRVVKWSVNVTLFSVWSSLESTDTSQKPHNRRGGVS